MGIRLRAQSFDAVCLGEACFTLGDGGVRPRGGAVNAALALARRGLRVALAISAADALGRALEEELEACGVAVSLGEGERSMLLTGTSSAVAAHDTAGLSVPEEWTSRVLLLSGVSPDVPYVAALCKAARAARRVGCAVVLDVNAQWQRWLGHDPRTMRALLREVDVLRCSPEDLAVLADDATALRAMVRADAVTITTTADGVATAAGPFGPITRAPPRRWRFRHTGAGDAFTAALCVELVRRDDRGDAFWADALAAGHVAAASERRAR